MECRIFYHVSSYFSDTFPARGAGPDSHLYCLIASNSIMNALKTSKYLEEAAAGVEASAIGLTPLELQYATNIPVLPWIEVLVILEGARKGDDLWSPLEVTRVTHWSSEHT